MKNQVGREIPDALLVNGKEVYQGKNYRDGNFYTKASPHVQIYERQQTDKLVDSIHDALLLCGIKDGMTISFHHHFRDGDYVVNMVMAEIAAMGIKNITIAASSLGSAHDPLVDYMEQGVVTGIQTSGIRGKLGEAVSHGKLPTPVILRSHGGRVRAIEEGDVHIDIA
ncbi:MAG: citrate lyase subunit alpha, partial [Pygmaiobacter sp.]